MKRQGSVGATKKHDYSIWRPVPVPLQDIYVTQTEGTVSPNTDRPGPVNNIFFSYLDLVSENFYFTLQPMCVEVGCVHVDEGRDRLQTKRKHYNKIFSL